MTGLKVEYKVFYNYEEFEGVYTEVFWGRTKDYAMALKMMEEIEEGNMSQAKAHKIWMEEVRKKIIKKTGE